MLSLLCLAALAQAPAAPKPFIAGPSVEGISEYRLPNGLTVLLVPDESVPKVTVNLTVFVGSRHEGYGEKGMAHLLEHLLFKGTPTTKDPKAALIARGADFNGTTSDDRTNYFEILTATDANTEWAIRFEADRLVNSYVAKKDLDTEMTVVRNEFEGSENNPGHALRTRVRAAAFPWHNYGRSTIGVRSDIELVPIENLQAFYKRYYRPDNAMLVVGGRFDAKKVFGWIAASFGKLPKPPKAVSPTFTAEPTQDGERHVTVRRVGGNPMFLASWHVPAASDPDFPALMVLQGIVGDVPQGRLHKELVDGKKAAHASCDVDQSKEPGLFSCFVTMRAGDTTATVRDVLFRVTEHLEKQPPTEAEVERSRTGWLSQMDNALNSSIDVALGLSEWGAIGDWRMMFVQRERLKAVTVAEVDAVAGKYFKPENRTTGEYVPTEKPNRAEVPLAPDVGPLVKALKPGEAVAKGEAFDPSPANIDARTTRLTLSNGAKLVLLPKKTRAQTVNVAMAFHYGSAAALAGQRDVGTMTVELLDKGTTTLNYKDFQTKLQELKAQVHVGPQPQAVVVTVEAKRPELLPVLDLVADMLTAPALDAAEFDVMKKGMLASLDQQKSEPRTLGGIELFRALSPAAKEHPMYVPTVPERIAGVGAVTIDQVRAFYRRFLGAQNGEIAIVGDFDPAEVKAKLEARLAKWVVKEPYVVTADPFFDSKPGEASIATPDKAQAWIGAGTTVKLTDEDPDMPALMLANAAFGGSPAARLFDVLREKQGLSYGAYSRLDVNEAVDGNRSAFLATVIYAPQNLSKVEASLTAEVTRFIAAGVTKDELETQRKTVLDDRQQSRANDRSLVFALANQARLGRTMAWEQKVDDALQAVTLEQVNATVKRHLDVSKLTVVKAGDFKPAPVAK
ncbi:MAG: insulinase family protein [Archangium sp.]|nr:insulinase family protein [Archangium sp.]